MMWGMGDGSSDVARGQRPPSDQSDVAGGAAAGAAGTMGRSGEASDAEIYGSNADSPREPNIPAEGEEAVRGRGYNEEMGWGQDGWENDNEEVMEDMWEEKPGSDDGWFGGGGGGSSDWGDIGDFGDWS